LSPLNEYARKVLTDPDIVRKFTDIGAVAWPTSSEEVTKARDLEEQRLLPVIKAAGILPT
jgi:tripartite-type tricarboxylate transporter receptor subunit TctC